MTARDFLRTYERADKRARRLREEYETELILIDAVRSLSDNDGMPHGTNISKPTEDKAVRLADKALSWKMAELDAIEARQTVFDMIYDIEGTAGEVLYYRFVALMSWDEVCSAVSHTWPTVRRYWHQGEDIVEDRLKRTRSYISRCDNV